MSIVNEYKDLLRDIAIERAEELAQQGWDVHFKFTPASFVVPGLP